MTTLNPVNVGARDIAEDQPETSGGNHIFQVVSTPSDPTPEQRLRIVEASGVLDFWDDPREDIYSLEDGEPV